MNFNKHFDKEGKHAILSASSWRWLNDDQESLMKRIASSYAQVIGTILHDFAAKHIQYRIKLNKYDKKNAMLELLTSGVPAYVLDSLDFDSIFENLMAYVNDGVGFKMYPEVVLYYSENFFGTADAISFNENERVLRIHDYKSGVIPAHIEQLEIYAALFCLEYRFKPHEIETHLRIYQSGEVLCHEPEPEEIKEVADKIVYLDKFLNRMRQEG